MCIIDGMVLPRFTPRQLDACIAAAELNSFSQAAKRLHLSPSAISNLITDLELSLGFALFERTTRKVVLTAAGREFLPAALAVQRQISRAQTAAIEIRNHATDIVRIAAPMAIAATLLPPLLAEYCAVQPRTTVRIVDAAVEWLGDRVSIGEADLAIGPVRHSHSDVEHVLLFESEWVLWLAPDDPLIGMPQLGWGDLSGRRVFAAGRDHEDSIKPQISMVFGDEAMPEVEVVESLVTALGMAAAGLGVTFSPKYVEPLGSKLGVIARPVEGPSAVRRVALYKSAIRPQSEPARELEAFLTKRLQPPLSP